MMLSTAIMDRGFYLKKTIKNWLTYNFDQIFVIDWSSKEDIKSIVDVNQNGKITYLRVDNQKYFNHAITKNLKARVVSDWFFNIDCDVLINKIPDITDKSVFYVGQGVGNWGTHLIHRETYDFVNGHNETLTGRAADDGDFYKRLCDAGYKKEYLELTHINHSQVLRVENMETKSNGRIWTLDDEQQKFECKMVYPDGNVEFNTV